MSTWKRTLIVVMVIASPAVYHLIMNLWFSFYLEYFEIMSPDSKFLTILKLCLFNLVGVFFFSAVYTSLLTLLHPPNIKLITITTAIFIITYDIVNYSYFGAFDLSYTSIVVFAEWSGILLTLMLFSFLLKNYNDKKTAGD